MKLLIKKLSFLLLAAASLLPAPRAVAATISMQGRILGLSTPTNDSLSTLDFYFFTALSDQTAQIAHAVIGQPVGSGTSLDLAVYLPPIPGDDADFLRRAGGATSNSAGTALLVSGQQYIVAFRPRNSDFDGYWPLPAVENCDAAFNFFDYNRTIVSDLRLDAIWKGQADGTFRIVTVPEPSAWIVALGSLAILGFRRSRRLGVAVVDWFMVAPASIPVASASPLVPDHDWVTQSGGQIQCSAKRTEKLFCHSLIKLNACSHDNSTNS